MASVAVTNTFVANTTASASEVNANFSDLVNYINNRNSGSATWDNITATSASATPLVANNSTGTNNIANFQDNGSNVLSVADGGATTISATAGGTSIALTVNNSTSTGNIARFQDNGSAVMTVLDGGGVTFHSADPGTPVSNTLYAVNVVKGWINFDGTGAIAISASFNVSSIVDNGAGDYTVNWNVDFSSANYCAIAMSTTAITKITDQAAGSSRVVCDGDSADVNVLAIGAQA